MDNKLINKANEEINETFVLFNELIKDFNNDEILKQDEELKQILENIQNEVEAKDEWFNKCLR